MLNQVTWLLDISPVGCKGVANGNLGLVVLWMGVDDVGVNSRRCELLLLGGRDGLDDQLGSGGLVFRGGVLTRRRFHEVPKH